MFEKSIPPKSNDSRCYGLLPFQKACADWQGNKLSKPTNPTPTYLLTATKTTAKKPFGTTNKNLEKALHKRRKGGSTPEFKTDRNKAAITPHNNAPQKARRS